MTPLAAGSPWFPYRVPLAGARLRLFCFPFAGKGASVFRGWQDQLPPWAEVWPVQYPGRETRFKERPFGRLETLVRALCAELVPALDRPFAFFGHSMGALVAFEAARLLRREYGLAPVHLFVSGQGAPQFARTTSPAQGPPVGVPLTAFGGLADEAVPWHALASWREQAAGPFGLYLLAGGHFFLQTAQAPLLRLLAGGLEGHAAGPPAGDEVHLWRVRLNVPAPALAALAATLAPDEQARAAHFLREQDRARFVASRAALRAVLAGYAGLPPECCRFGYTAHGKPFLLGPPALTRLQFNLSHSDDLALVAVACDRPVGVDVERIRPEVDVPGVGRLVFSQAERHALDRVPRADRLAAFFDLWARKEAYLKCLGLGFSGSPGQVTVGPAGAEGPCFLANLSLVPGYAAAVAVEGGWSHLRCADWDCP
jgi:surfactin synthase thioesterase subunit/phosphopantetheinyl transferase